MKTNCLCAIAASCLLSGCSILSMVGLGPLPAVKVGQYCMSVAGTNRAVKAPVRVAIQQVDGRAPYQRDKIRFSASPYTQDFYQNAVWAQNPCDMLSAELLTYFSRNFQYATPLPRINRTPVDTVIVAYIDAFDQICRDGQWQAHARIKYELLTADGSALLAASWFERTVPLASSALDEYVAAQNTSLAELCAEIDRAIITNVKPAPLPARP